MVDAPLFEIRDLHVAADGAEILRGVDLTGRPGEVHALMGLTFVLTLATVWCGVNLYH